MIYTVTLNPALDKEYSVPSLKTNSVLRASTVKNNYGGKGINVSRMLNSLGIESTALGFIGGYTGKSLCDGLEELGISTDFVKVGAETRTNFSIVNSIDETYMKVNEAGPTISHKERNQLIDSIRRSIQPGDLWVLAGGLPPGINPNFYAQMIDLIDAGGSKACLDTSGKPLKLGCKPGLFLMKPNIEEAAQLTGLEINSRESMRAAIQNMHQLGAENILLSAGKHKSVFSTGKRLFVGIPPKIEEKNPIGAGDAMLAAVIFRIEQGDDMRNAFAWGLAAGSAAAGMPGTEMATKSMVMKLLKKVVITEE